MRDPTTLSSDELMGLIVDARWFAAKGRTLESAEVVGVLGVEASAEFLAVLPEIGRLLAIPVLAIV